MPYSTMSATPTAAKAENPLAGILSGLTPQQKKILAKLQKARGEYVPADAFPCRDHRVLRVQIYHIRHALIAAGVGGVAREQSPIRCGWFEGGGRGYRLVPGAQ
jgi:hypothetical protein